MIEAPNPKNNLKNPEIVTVGTVNVDLIMGPQAPWPIPGTEVILPDANLREGGGAGITAKALTALGIRHRMVVNIGNDLFGDWLMKQYPDLVDDWIIDSVDTALTVGITHPDGERTFFSTPGHVAQFQPLELQNKLAGMDLNNVIVLFVGTSLMPTIRPALIKIFEFVKSKGGLIALDTAWPTDGWTKSMRAEVLSWIPYTDIVLLNEAEAQGLLSGERSLSSETTSLDYQSILKQMSPNSLFVTKLGKDGARVDRLGSPPLIKKSDETIVKDTIGAGDSFNAGFLAAYARSQSIETCLQVAVDTARHAISSHPRCYPGSQDVGLKDYPDQRSAQKIFKKRKQAV
ncbi:carbohydrate kinase family protein [Kiloniella majae]|uniref:carbohydrate kinase family protein n=1 Tax=Kiloniella majae TaxID=1938558 RepID=UPI000A27724C|nr:carbohydrate kinase family protein [Kiloniella majae]